MNKYLERLEEEGGKDIEKRVIYIPKAKAGAREQPITQSLADFLQGYINKAKAAQEWLFPSENSVTGHVVNVNKPFKRVVKKAGLDPAQVVRHTLRHTAITHLVQAGVDLPTVQRISGHKTLQMVVRYSHQNGEHIQAAMDALEKRYDSINEAGNN
ncbi:MAG TPA: site-specific integrase [Gammaproteobacteria bacterium]|jgi:integrase|nr:site-specific integrase [Gammaproteobacteria bacterium]